MAGIRWPPEDPDLIHTRATQTVTASDLISDDDRSVAADSWSIKSDYGSTLDDDQRHVDASELLSTCNLHAASDYSSDKEAPDANEVEPSVLGLQSYWDDTYVEDLANFHQHGHAGEVWFGADVMDTVATWSRRLCIDFNHDENTSVGTGGESESSDEVDKDLSRWNVLDIGTGNGLLLHEMKKQGFTNLTGTDYSETGINLARSLATHNGHTDINFLVDDILDSKLEKQFNLVLDKGTLDAIGLHPEGPARRIMYWESVSKLIAPGGILVITSCNHTKDELLEEVENFNQKTSQDSQNEAGNSSDFQYLDHVQTYPTIMFGGIEGSRVATVAFLHG
ncbi:Methyltransferase-like protein [Zostera marina]|uniref:Protein-lysine N-methyltransferase ZOSMA_35G00420 n=1 Tax=Zostera marina TaxID=29655 RepID=A0A0K9P6E1_ZOSMR|nr:Methyltransferase-like protein [Zostera marina]